MHYADSAQLPGWLPHLLARLEVTTEPTPQEPDPLHRAPPRSQCRPEAADSRVKEPGCLDAHTLFCVCISGLVI